MILYLCDEHPDYGADWLYDGMCEQFGAASVIDWPPKPSLHHGERKVFDCDQAWPEHDWSEVKVVTALRDRAFDLIVVPTLRGTTLPWLRDWRTLGLWELNADRIVVVDGEDHAMNTRPLYAQALGCEPKAYCKRELPPGETWAIPLPFGYPERRIMPVGRLPNTRTTRAVYMAHIWPWAVAGLRERLAEQLRKTPGVLTRVTYNEGSWRKTPTEYHDILSTSTINVAPAGQGYFTNRLFETLAAGCALVAEAPTMTFPGALVEPLEWRTFRNEFEAADIVRELLDDPEATREIAEAGQAALRDRHTTRHRAETVWNAVYR